MYDKTLRYDISLNIVVDIADTSAHLMNNDLEQMNKTMACTVLIPPKTECLNTCISNKSQNPWNLHVEEIVKISVLTS